MAYTSFGKAYEAVEKGECDCAVLPVENSFAGDVDQVNDLMFTGHLFINGMYDLAVTHDLLGVPGAALADIQTVVSIRRLCRSAPLLSRKRSRRDRVF